MYTSSEHTTDSWWQRLQSRLTILYLAIALALLIIGGAGQLRLLAEIGHVFGGFFWAIDTDGQVVLVSTPPQLSAFGASLSSLTNRDYIIAANGRKGPAALSQVYQHARPGDPITYTVQHGNKLVDFVLPATTFTADLWWQNYGLAFIAGISWLLVGVILLATAPGWVGAVEGLTLLPPAMFFLLSSHWGNVQQPYPADLVVQLLWIPSFALLGAAFIHLSLTYRPEAIRPPRTPRFMLDGLPYVPLIALVAFEWSAYLIFHQAPMRPNALIALGYGGFGGAVSLCIGSISLVRVSGLLPGTYIPAHIRRSLADLLTLWIGGAGLGFCLGMLPILLTGKTLLPLPIFYILTIVYPLLLLYAIRSLRLMDRLQMSLEQHETALSEQQKTTEALRQTNKELQRATSLLLHADAHLRANLSQRIHDQPKQQALRIRSLLGHWQHKLKVEAEHDPAGRVSAQPIIEALGKVRKISEELEGDLGGLQLLVEDAYQRRSLGLKLHLEKLIREDLPALHPESSLKVQSDLRALDVLDHDWEQSAQEIKIAEAISYTVTQALLNVYNHAGASFATVHTIRLNNSLEVHITDDGRGFDPSAISPEKTSLLKAQLKAHEAGGILVIQAVPRPQVQHGTNVMLRVPLPHAL